MYIEWIEKGLSAPGKTKGGLAKAAGISASAMSMILKGGRQIKAHELAKMASYLEQPIPSPTERAFQTTGEVVPNSRAIPAFFDTQKQMPVHASAEGGGGAIILSIEPVQYVPRPHNLSGVERAYGIIIEGESMIPAYSPGDTAFVNPVPGPRRESDCIFYQIQDSGEAKATIKRLLTWSDTEWTVEQFNPSRKFKLSRSEWQTCHRVVGKMNRP